MNTYEKNANEKHIISKIHPLAKLVFVTVLCVISIMSKDYRFGYLIVFPLMLIFAFLEGKGLRYAKRIITVLLVMFAFMFLLKGLFDPSTEILWVIGPLKFKKAGVEGALGLTSDILVFASTLLLFFETTDLEDFMISLQKIGMSHMQSFIFLSTLQMIPEFFKKSKIIMQAQRARGIETEGNVFVRVKAFFPTLTPLIISSISDIEEKVITMEARAFSADVKKTHLKIIRANTFDYILMVLSLILLVLYIVWRYVYDFR